MRSLIIKLDAAGDVVRTTTLLHIIKGEIHWLTSNNNMILLNTIPEIEKCIPWNKRTTLRNIDYDFVVNLEDSIDTAQLLNEIKYKELFGAYLNKSNKFTYTESSKEWFNMSLISNFGIKKADELKLRNRKSFQKIIFDGLGFEFKGEKYFLPKPIETDLKGDIAIAPKSGSIWPMKNWAYYSELKAKLEKNGYTVNFLPLRDTLLEHIGDIINHKYLISGDTLPMHIALGNSTKCLSIFICTSPWEIYGYGIQTKVVSPYLEKYFYKRILELEATTSISLKEVYEKVIQKIGFKKSKEEYSNATYKLAQHGHS